MIDPKGHFANSPAEIPARGWQDIVKRTYIRTWDDNIGIVAAGVAFYSFFALLSLLGLIVLIYGVVADPLTVVGHVRTLVTVLPANVALVIGDHLMTAVRTSQGTKGIGILVAGTVALYGGTSGAAAVLTALNIAYEEKEKRRLVGFYLLALAMTVGALVTALVALAATAAVAFLQHLLPQATPAALVAGKVGGYCAMSLMAAAVAATLYRFGPSREDARWTWITPGSVFTAIGWLLLTLLFGWYVTNLTDYSATYGSLGASVGLLTWMYLLAYVFMVGAELNSEIEHQTAMDSTTGAPRPLGERGAWAADNVAMTDEVTDRPEEVREGERLTAAAPEIEDEKT